MPRGRKPKIFHIRNRKDAWMAGKDHKLKTGQVFRFKVNNKIGVIRAPHIDIETYEAKVYIGPKPWDSSICIVSLFDINIVDEPNPMIYDWSDRLPGPSVPEIKRLNAKMSEITRKKFENWTAEHSEIAVQSIEESLILHKELPLKKEEGEVEDSNISESSEIIEEVLPVDPIDQKRQKIIEDEV